LAELVLNRANYESADVSAAGITISAPTFDVSIRVQDVANAITGMFDTKA
jgi:hypothetical protein